MRIAIGLAAVILAVVPTATFAQKTPEKEALSTEKAAAAEKAAEAQKTAAMQEVVAVPVAVKPMVLPAAPVTMKPPPPKSRPTPPPVPMIIAPIAITYVYTATPQSGPPRRLGSVEAGAVWTCDQTRCTMTTANAQPAVGGCNALAHQIGPIASYGWSKVTLSPSDIDQCNRGVPGAVRMAADAPAPNPPPADPAFVPASEASSGESTPAAAPSAAPTGMLIAVAELALGGGNQGTVDSSAGNITITSAELSLSGGAAGTPPATPPPRTISVPELSIAGR